MLGRRGKRSGSRAARRRLTLRPRATPDRPEGVGGQGDTVARNAVFALATQMITAAFTAAITVFLVRALGPSDYGIYSLAIAIGVIVMLPADFGISASVARFIAERRGERRAVARLFANGLKLKLIASGVVCSLLVLSAGPIASAYDAPALAWPLRAVAAATFGQSLMLYCNAAFIALGRISINLRIVGSESAVETGAILGLVLLAGGASGAAFGRTVGYLVGGLVALALARRVIGRSPGEAERGGGSLRRIAGYAGALFVLDGTYALLSHIDVLLLGAIVNATAVGLFQAPMMLTTFLHYPGLALANAVAPRIARHEAYGPSVEAFQFAVRLMLILQAGIATAVVVWAQPIVDLVLGAGYEESAGVLRALAPFIFLSGIAPLVALGVNYLGAAQRRIPIAIAALVVNGAANVILIPKMGILGAAIGTNLGYLVYVPAHFWLCMQMLSMPVTPIALTLLRSMIAAAAMATVLWVVGTSGLSAVEWLVGCVGGALTFAIVLTGTREFGRDEIDQLQRALAQIRA